MQVVVSVKVCSLSFGLMFGNVCNKCSCTLQLHYVQQRYIIFHYIVLHYVTFLYVTLHHIIFHSIPLHSIQLHCVTFHCCAVLDVAFKNMKTSVLKALAVII